MCDLIYPKKKSKNAFYELRALLLIAFAVSLLGSPGCRSSIRVNYGTESSPCQIDYQQIETPRLSDPTCECGNDFFTGPPPTIENFQSLEPLPMTLEEAVHLTLQNSKVLQKLGGQVVAGPQGTSTIYDPALQVTNPAQGIEAALSAFDAQMSVQANAGYNERSFNNVFFGGGAARANTHTGQFIAELSKTAATGTRFALRNQTDYNRSDVPSNLFASAWDTVNYVEARQPLLRGFGTTVNRIAGPDALPGQYNGVLIARVRNDIALADFESSIRDLVRDVEQTYWELYYAYRDLDAKIRARDVARSTWQKRKILVEGGEGRPDDEAQARQAYFNFDIQVQDALVGQTQGLPGVFGAERNLRRLTGMNSYDGRLIQPITDPVKAPIVFDWDQAQLNATERRVEIRRQKWNVKQRELELCAAKQLNKWDLDLVGQYGWRGFGDNLFGSRSRPNGSAWEDFTSGDLDEWSVGLELGGPIGNRTGHVAIRNATLNLCREKSLLREQQRQIIMDLSAAYAEVDRSHASIASNFNRFQAVVDELEPKRLRAEEGEDDIFFLLNTQQQAAQSESAFHRAVADYNLALLNFTYTSGELLSTYGICLTESDWNNLAEMDAHDNAARFLHENPPRKRRDIAPVSNGPFDQSLEMVTPVESNQ